MAEQDYRNPIRQRKRQNPLKTIRHSGRKQNKRDTGTDTGDDQRPIPSDPAMDAI
ncbi:hypothetical protein [Rubripirellula lacrimiformis]|uniref:hypothetical protein n=1 Tax=Rubripirellula lacrimiformis TaxID=1930273 RepID=UPI001C54C2A0|nr:hypothetical protein [Rubripirellula lacrimiformis]